MRASTSSLLLLILGSSALGGALVACGDSGGSGATGTESTGTTGVGGDNGTTGVGGNGATTGTMSTGTMMGQGGSTSSGPLTCASEVSNIPVGECDIFLQDCPNANQTCTFVDNAGQTETGCVTANGLKGIGQDCANRGECQAGLFCIGMPGTCTPACCPDTDEPCGPGDCNLSVSVPGGAGDLQFMACTYSDQCTLLMPDSCVPSEDCHLQEAGFAVCSQPSGNDVMEGELCIYVNDCGDSQNCIGGTDPMDPSYCRYFCESGSTAAPGLGGCPMGQTCNTNFDTGFPNTGFCLPP